MNISKISAGQKIGKKAVDERETNEVKGEAVSNEQSDEIYKDCVCVYILNMKEFVRREHGFSLTVGRNTSYDVV